MSCHSFWKLVKSEAQVEGWSWGLSLSWLSYLPLTQRWKTAIAPAPRMPGSSHTPGWRPAHQPSSGEEVPRGWGLRGEGDRRAWRPSPAGHSHRGVDDQAGQAVLAPRALWSSDLREGGSGTRQCSPAPSSLSLECGDNAHLPRGKVQRGL